MYKSGNTENWKENRWQIKMQSQVENWDSIDFPKSPMTNAEGIKMDHMTEWRPQKKERRRTSGESEEFNSLTMVRMDKKKEKDQKQKTEKQKNIFQMQYCHSGSSPGEVIQHFGYLQYICFYIVMVMSLTQLINPQSAASGSRQKEFEFQIESKRSKWRWKLVSG